MRKSRTRMSKEKRLTEAGWKRPWNMLKSQSTLALPNRIETSHANKGRILPFSPTKNSPSPSPITTSQPTPLEKQKPFRGGGGICQVGRKALEKDLSSQRKALLRPFIKCTSVNLLSTEDPRNFLQAPGVITLIWSLDGKLKYGTWIVY